MHLITAVIISDPSVKQLIICGFSGYDIRIASPFCMMQSTNVPSCRIVPASHTLRADGVLAVTVEHHVLLKVGITRHYLLLSAAYETINRQTFFETSNIYPIPKGLPLRSNSDCAADLRFFSAGTDNFQ